MFLNCHEKPLSCRKCCADAGGTIQDYNGVFCLACPGELHCPVGSTFTDLWDAGGTEDLRFPFVKKGFNSNLPG